MTLEDNTTRLRKLLNGSICELAFSNRVANALEQENIVTIGLLASKTPYEITRIRNLGKLSWKEIKDKLRQLNLSLGMRFEDGLVDPAPPLEVRYGTPETAALAEENKRLRAVCTEAADALAYEMTGRHSQLEIRDWSELIAKLRNG